MNESPTRPSRSYDDAVVRAGKITGDRAERMQRVCDILWDAFSHAGYSWVGFYTAAAGDDEMILACRRDTPACSPIGLHGACGVAWSSGDALVVHDVKDLGDSYIACDPRDQSEVVMAVFDEDGSAWGVIDVDSHEVGSFDQRDVEGVRAVLVAAGLTHDNSPKPTRHA